MLLVVAQRQRLAQEHRQQGHQDQGRPGLHDAAPPARPGGQGQPGRQGGGGEHDQPGQDHRDEPARPPHEPGRDLGPVGVQGQQAQHGHGQGPSGGAPAAQGDQGEPTQGERERGHGEEPGQPQQRRLVVGARPAAVDHGVHRLEQLRAQEPEHQQDGRRGHHRRSDAELDAPPLELPHPPPPHAGRRHPDEHGQAQGPHDGGQHHRPVGHEVGEGVAAGRPVGLVEPVGEGDGQPGREPAGAGVEAAGDDQRAAQPAGQQEQQQHVGPGHVAQPEQQAGRAGGRAPAGPEGDHDAEQDPADEELGEDLAARVLGMPDLQHVGGQEQPGDGAGEQAEGAPGGQGDQEHGQHREHRGHVGQPGVSAGREAAGQQGRPQVVELHHGPGGVAVLDPDAGEAGLGVLPHHLDRRDARPVKGRVLQVGGTGAGDGHGMGDVRPGVLADPVGEPGEEQEGGHQPYPEDHGQGGPVKGQPRPGAPGDHGGHGPGQPRQADGGRQAVAAGVGQHQAGPGQQADADGSGQGEDLGAVHRRPRRRRRGLVGGPRPGPLLGDGHGGKPSAVC